MFGFIAFAALPLSVSGAVTYTATYTPQNAPNRSEQGQTGTNKCGTGYNQTSICQNAYQPGPNSDIGNTERIEVSWCTQAGYGTRIIPDGSIQGAHFVQTPDYVQVTGWGDLTKLNILKGDAGGELDPHGADGNGNPIGGLVFSSAFTGTLTQLHEWTNFMSATEFCFRGCKDGSKAPALCQHIYDEMGCMWNMPGNYDVGSFDNCQGDSGEPMGVYGTSTFHQGDAFTPDAHPAPSKSSCVPVATISNSLPLSSGASTVSSTVSASTPISASGASSTSSSAVSSSSSSPSASAPSQASATSTSAPSVSRTGSISTPLASQTSSPSTSHALKSAAPRFFVVAAAIAALVSF
ncbi:hypothetical protein K488DRAFT_68950 [Vararia minispora EC-137]|uniref:Uncharacterized protein n=1 Tax=Vararia minispora EC-137 TaxID=1314806 RepID=A0ACB8QSK5_9AGAM|nr:hypothetical protein K488DRAFT_68950 [Vararia minispora EC-137]